MHEGAQQGLNTNDHMIVNVPNPVNLQNVTNNQYVDQHNILVSRPTNNVRLNSVKITDLQEATESWYAVTKHYVDRLFNHLKD